MKNKLWLILAILIVGTFVFGTCAQQAPQAPPEPATTTPAEPTTPSTPSKVWELKYTTWDPAAGHAFISCELPYLRLLEAVSDGRLKITAYPGSMLCKAADQYDFIASGAADIGTVSQGYTPGRFPVAEMMSLPNLGITSSLQGARVCWGLYQKFPDVFNEQYKGVKQIGHYTTDPFQLFSTKPIRSTEDLKGKKIKAANEPIFELLRELGATPVSISVFDMYVNLQKGVVDGALTDWFGCGMFKTYEVAKNATVLNLYVSPQSQIMNLDTWNSFPPDLQEKLQTVFGLATSQFYADQVFGDMSYQFRDDISNMPGFEVHTLPADSVAKISAVAKPIQDAYAADLEAKGLPGKALLAETLRLVELTKE